MQLYTEIEKKNSEGMKKRVAAYKNAAEGKVKKNKTEKKNADKKEGN